MTLIDPDELDRTMKLELDSGRGLEEARELVKSYVLQIDVGPAIETSDARQAALLTALNAGRRAFPGGVLVRTIDNPQLTAAWGMRQRLRVVLERFGATLVDGGALEPGRVTLVIGDPPAFSRDARLLHPTFEGWSGAVVQQRADRLPERADFSLAGVLAGALGVSEVFQSVRGDVLATRRDVGLSLWRPDLPWRAAEARGDHWRYLPSRLWLLGLGHLGQAMAWTIGLLPYADPREVQVFVQDDDTVVKANAATGMLVAVDWKPDMKTRLVARQLESLGMCTRILERRFDAHTRRSPDEPGLAMAGFDDPEPRRALEEAHFDKVIDLGLGGGPAQYVEIHLHAFPSGLAAATAFTRVERRDRAEALLELPGYRAMREELASRALSDDEIRCGLLEVAGRSVGAAFVGAAAASLGVAEAIRMLVGGPQFEVVGLSLRSPQFVDAAANRYTGPPRNPGYAPARVRA